MSIGVQAQILKYVGKNFNLPKFVIEANESANGASEVVYKSKNLIVDEVNGYVFNLTTTTEGNTQTSNTYLQYAVWNSSKGKIVGYFYAYTDLTKDSVSTANNYTNDDGSLSPNLMFVSTDHNNTLLVGKTYNGKEIMEAYQKALNKMTARGSEGSECVYVEMPRKGTTIKLFIALGSEIAKNSGVPKWKIPFGELIFNKTTAKFTFVQK